MLWNTEEPDFNRIAKFNVCIQCNTNCYVIGTHYVRCPDCGTEYLRTDLSSQQVFDAYGMKGASWIPQAYNPVWGCSSLDQIEELTGKKITFLKEWPK